MSEFTEQKAKKLTIEEVAAEQLSGEISTEFAKFLDYLKSEKITTSWKSINGYHMKFKGKNVGAIGLGAPGWLDDAIHRKNYINIFVGTAERDDYDGYLQGQSDEIVDLFLERMEIKCRHCRPTCGCSSWMWNRTVAGKLYEDCCANAPAYGFHNIASDLSEVILQSPCAVYPPMVVRAVPFDTVKKLISARKDYIARKHGKK
jgi:hypothetical protein